MALSWDAPPAAKRVTRHEYRYKTTGDYLATWTEIADSGAGGANEAGYTVTGLTNGTAYTFEVRAVNASGDGAASETGPVTPAVRLLRLVVSDLSGKIVPLSPGFLGSRKSYTASVAHGVDTVQITVQAVEGATVAYLDGEGNPYPDAKPRADGMQAALAPGANVITVRVTAEDSPALDYTVTVTRSLPEGQLAVPAVEAPSGTAGALEVSWTAPAGGATAYQVKYWEADTDGRSFSGPKQTTETTFPILFLDAGGEYKVAVRARGADGWGPWSDSTKARTGRTPLSDTPVLTLRFADGGTVATTVATSSSRWPRSLSLVTCSPTSSAESIGSERRPSQHDDRIVPHA